MTNLWNHHLVNVHSDYWSCKKMKALTHHGIVALIFFRQVHWIHKGGSTVSIPRKHEPLAGCIWLRCQNSELSQNFTWNHLKMAPKGIGDFRKFGNHAFFRFHVKIWGVVCLKISGRHSGKKHQPVTKKLPRGEKNHAQELLRSNLPRWPLKDVSRTISALSYGIFRSISGISSSNHHPLAKATWMSQELSKRFWIREL